MDLAVATSARRTPPSSDPGDHCKRSAAPAPLCPPSPLCFRTAPPPLSSRRARVPPPPPRPPVGHRPNRARMRVSRSASTRGTVVAVAAARGRAVAAAAGAPPPARRRLEPRPGPQGSHRLPGPHRSRPPQAPPALPPTRSRMRGSSLLSQCPA
eukprot:scaffold86197_cov67-Phaeocystis_antarctica.AAC.2